MLPSLDGKSVPSANGDTSPGPFDILQGIMNNPGVAEATIKATAYMKDGSSHTTWAGLNNKGKKHLFQSSKVPKIPQ